MRQAMKDAAIGKTGKTADMIRAHAPEGKRVKSSGWKVKRGGSNAKRSK